MSARWDCRELAGFQCGALVEGSGVGVGLRVPGINCINMSWNGTGSRTLRTDPHGCQDYAGIVERSLLRIMVCVTVASVM